MADENEPPPESKLTRSKARWAREGKFLTGKISRPEETRDDNGDDAEADSDHRQQKNSAPACHDLYRKLCHVRPDFRALVKDITRTTILPACAFRPSAS